MKTLLRVVTNTPPLSRTGAITTASQILRLVSLPAGSDARLIAKRLGFDVVPHRGATVIRDGVMLFDDRANVRDRNYHMSLAIVHHMLQQDGRPRVDGDAVAVARALCRSASGVFQRIA